MATVVQQVNVGGESNPLVKRILIGAAVLLVLVLAAWGLSQIKLGSGNAGPKRQTVKITLPDTPPPPPPPKQEEKRTDPKEDNKPTPQMEQKPVEAPPQPAQSLKMEGAAGDGPSAFSAGSVSKDYTNGQVNTGQGGGTGTSSDRAKYQFYVNSAKQMLKDEIERNLQSEQKQVIVSFSLWVKPDGTVDRYELSSTGNERADQDIKAAFVQMAKAAKLPPPRDTPQPLRLRMTLLPIAS